MAWIYFQVLEGSDSHYRLGSEPFVIANETDTHKAFFCPECDQVTLIRPLFGMTSQHYERSCCLESTLSQEAFRARISALQAVERAWTESEAVFSSRSQDSLENANLDLFSSRMSLPSEPVEGKEWSKNWPRSGMTVDGQLFQPPQLEPLTKETGGSYWLTPRATDTGSGENQETFLKRMGDRTDRCAQSLPAQVKNPKTWPTPTASDHLHNQSEMLENWQKRAEEKKKQGINLQFALRHAVQMWPTPTVCGNYQHKGNMIGLATAVRMCSVEKKPGQLSPMWVEWLMGYRIGWTELSAWATQWFRSKSEKPLKNSQD